MSQQLSPVVTRKTSQETAHCHCTADNTEVICVGYFLTLPRVQYRRKNFPFDPRLVHSVVDDVNAVGGTLKVRFPAHLEFDCPETTPDCVVEFSSLGESFRCQASALLDLADASLVKRLVLRGECRGGYVTGILLDRFVFQTLLLLPVLSSQFFFLSSASGSVWICVFCSLLSLLAPLLFLFSSSPFFFFVSLPSVPSPPSSSSSPPSS